MTDNTSPGPAQESAATGISATEQAGDASPGAKSALAPRDLALIALFAAFIAVLGLPGAIPIFGSPVPITAQTLGVMLAPSILGARRGALAIVAFLVLVAAGLPLLSGGRGGLGVFAGASAGYLVGWIFGSYVIGLLVDRILPKYRFWPGLLFNVIGGIVVIYAFGVPVTAWRTGSWELATVLSAAQYLPGDLLKAVLAAAIAAGVHRAYPVPRAGRPRGQA
ncbi:biotin transporter BioY [Nonomuraea jabiensis]|uniref:Biotin transporter n=1 Tax=Nonomuraea jabiensis TaxID=882448 RepID=A0A7W9GGA0_9ACTN|nr:biotin transporter BioY [Nonomuraea jabiensis]MBB5783243.1 biotin transport system substrate-specific component [Nonomuraea jabiensis]